MSRFDLYLVIRMSLIIVAIKKINPQLVNSV